MSDGPDGLAGIADDDPAELFHEASRWYEEIAAPWLRISRYRRLTRQLPGKRLPLPSLLWCSLDAKFGLTVGR